MKNLLFKKTAKFLGWMVLISSIEYNAHTVYSTEFSDSLDSVSSFLETGKSDSAAVLLFNIVDKVSDKTERVRTYYYLSQALGNLGYLGEEIQFLIMAREESSGTEFSDRVNLSYAKILLDTGNYDECLGIVDEFISSNENSPLLPEMMFLSGNANFMKGEYRRAFSIYADIYEKFPNNPKAFDSILKQGLCLYKLELTGGAIEKFEQYIANNPKGDNSDALYYLGLSYEIARQFDSASDTFGKLLKEYTGYRKILDVYFHLGKNCYETGKYTEASNAFKNYTLNSDKNDPNYNESLLFMERILYRKGVYKNEIEIYENFVQKYPDNPYSGNMLFELARFYKTAGNIENAIEKYRILMTMRHYLSEADSAAYLYGDTMFSMERSSEAAYFIENAAHKKKNIELYQNMIFRIAVLYEKWEDFDNAVSWYDSTYIADASRDKNILSLMGVGRILKKMDRWVESAKTYERIIREYPENPYIKTVYLSLSEVYLLQGKTRAAVANAEKAMKYSSQREKTDILLGIAQMYEDIDENRALNLYYNIYNNSRNSRKQIADALMNYGNLSFRLGDNTSAAKAYASIISGNLDSLTVRKAREKLTFILDSTN